MRMFVADFLGNRPRLESFLPLKVFLPSLCLPALLGFPFLTLSTLPFIAALKLAGLALGPICFPGSLTTLLFAAPFFFLLLSLALAPLLLGLLLHFSFSLIIPFLKFQHSFTKGIVVVLILIISLTLQQSQYFGMVD